MVGLDNSARQLEHARRAMAAAGATFPLVHASAEAVPLPSESFDIVFCDHGALTFCDPHLAVPEAARLLRPGGLLAFSMNTPIVELVWPADVDEPGTELVRDYFGLHAIEFEGITDFQLSYGEWIRLFVGCGLVVEDLLELRPSADAVSSYRSEHAREWARRWPMEHIWQARKGGG
jgi:SAM-dependent methyltransferase